MSIARLFSLADNYRVRCAGAVAHEPLAIRFRREINHLGVLGRERDALAHGTGSQWRNCLISHDILQWVKLPKRAHSCGNRACTPDGKSQVTRGFPCVSLAGRSFHAPGILLRGCASRQRKHSRDCGDFLGSRPAVYQPQIKTRSVVLSPGCVACQRQLMSPDCEADPAEGC